MNKFLVSMIAFWNTVTNPRLDREKGATATEYALLIAFVALAIIAGATLFGTALSDWFKALASNIGSWASAPA